MFPDFQRKTWTKIRFIQWRCVFRSSQCRQGGRGSGKGGWKRQQSIPRKSALLKNWFLHIKTPPARIEHGGNRQHQCLKEFPLGPGLCTHANMAWLLSHGLREINAWKMSKEIPQISWKSKKSVISQQDQVRNMFGFFGSSQEMQPPASLKHSKSGLGVPASYMEERSLTLMENHHTQCKTHPVAPSCTE